MTHDDVIWLVVYGASLGCAGFIGFRIGGLF